MSDDHPPLKSATAGGRPAEAEDKSGFAGGFVNRDDSELARALQDPTKTEAARAAFFARLLGGDPAWWGYWWTAEDKRSHWWPVTHPAPIPSGAGLNVYFGILPVLTQGGVNQRGRKSTIAALGCVFSEWDAKDFCDCGGAVVTLPAPDGGPDRRVCTGCGTHDPAPCKDAALAKATHIDPRPSVLVDSGGGYHGYWLLDRPFVLTTDEDRRQADQLVKGWVSYTGGDPGAKDLARVLRVPGTRNYKPERGPDFPLVTFVWAEMERLYRLEDLETMVADAATPPTVQPTPTQTMTPAPNGHRLPYVEAALWDELATLRKTAKGNRNPQLNESAFNLGQLVGGGYLDRAEVEAELESAALAIGLDEREIRATIKSGLDAGEQQPRQVPEPMPKHTQHPTQSPGTPHPPAMGNDPKQAETSDSDAHSEDRPESWPYVADGGRLYFCKQSEDGIERSLIADLEARIVEEAQGEDGESYFHLEGRTVHGRPFAFDIAAADFSDTAKLRAALTGAAGARAAILPRMALHLAPAIQRLTPATVATSKRFDRTGWADDHFLIPGREPAGVTLHLPRKLPYGFATEADLDKGLEALAALILAMGADKTTPILAMLFEAPLARLARLENERYGMMIVGRTGTYKTSWAQTAMSIYGAAFGQDDRLIKWGEGATRNAIMKLSSHANDLPLLVDNYKPGTGGGMRDFVNLIHNLLEGGEKDRLTRTAELRDTRPVHTWPLFTGEDVPDNDPATLARILVVPFGWRRGEPNPHLTHAQRLRDHLPAVGAAWLDWLEGDGAEVAQEIGLTFPDERQTWAYRLIAMRQNMANAARVASNLASNALAWRTLEQHPTIGPIVKGYADDYAHGLETMAASMADYTAESLEALRFLGALRSLLAGGRYVLIEKGSRPVESDRDRMLGYRDPTDESAYIMVDIAREKVRRELGANLLGEISNVALFRQLEALEMIASSNPGRLTKTVRPGPGEKLIKALHLKPAALEEDDNDLEHGEI